MSDAIAAAFRASLRIALERGMTLEQVLAEGVDRVAANNAAQVIALEDTP